jgi:hypothetical protein
MDEVLSHVLEERPDAVPSDAVPDPHANIIPPGDDGRGELRA